MAVLTWDDKPQKDQSGKILSVSYKTTIPHWGAASVHPHIHYPGEMFLDCAGLGIEMHPLGHATAESTLDMLNPAEMVLMKALEPRGIWCLEALVAIGGKEE